MVRVRDMETTNADENLAGRKRALDEMLLRVYRAGIVDENPKVRVKCIRGLEGLRSIAVEAAPDLERALADNDARVRKAAEVALARLTAMSRAHTCHAIQGTSSRSYCCFPEMTVYLMPLVSGFA